MKHSIREKIYGLLYENSRVDGIRLINEDEWPINELLSLFDETVKGVIGENEETRNHVDIIAETYEAIMNDVKIGRNALRQSQLKKWEELK